MPFHDGPIEGLLVQPLERHEDSRGWLVELFRADDVPPERLPAMAYASMTLPGASRGPHEHRQQTDLFACFGPGDLTLFAWDMRSESPTFEHRLNVIIGQSNPACVVIPPGIVHGYCNQGDEPALVFNAPDRLYAGPGRSGPVDEIRYEDDPDSPFQFG